MNLRLPMLAVAVLTLSGCVTVTEQYADEGYFSSPNNVYSGGGDNGYFSSDNTYYRDYGQHYYSPYRPTINFSFNFFFGSPYYYDYSSYGSCWYSNCYGYHPYYGGHHPHRPKPPKPPKPVYPIVDRDGPIRPGPGWQPRTRRTATVALPVAAMSTVAQNPAQAAGTLSNTNRPRRAQIADQSHRTNAEALPQQNPRSQRLAREPQARTARQERASSQDDHDP